jgi:type I restriction enzyme M protein
LLSEKKNVSICDENKKDIATIENKIRKLGHHISEKTIGGQIWLALNDKAVSDSFGQFWLENRVMKKIDYPIFFAVNQKPLKDESGEYRYKKGPDGELLIDGHGHPVIDHDLDDIAESFVKYAREQGFDFWKD